MGPFVDSEHPEIKKGTVDRTFGDIFHEEIIRRVWISTYTAPEIKIIHFIKAKISHIYMYLMQLLDYTEFMGSAARVVLVPSTRDASHDFVLPQVLACLVIF